MGGQDWSLWSTQGLSEPSEVSVSLQCQQKALTHPSSFVLITGPNVKAVATAVEQIYPFVFESRKEIL